MARISKPWYRADKDAWYCRIDGRRISLGIKGSESAKLAEDAWHKRMAVDRAGIRPKPTTLPTVAEVISVFLADAETRVSSDTLKFYHRFLDPFSATYGHLRTDALTCQQAEAWARESTWSNSTRHDALGTLATCFRWAVEKAKLLNVSPVKGMTLPPKESQGAEAVITAEDFAKLLEATDGDFRALLRFLWSTGCRPSEATGLTVADLTGAEGVIVLRKHKTAHKGKSRVLYLNDEAQAVLNEQVEKYKEGLLFRNNNGEQWRRNAIVNRMWRLQKSLKISATAYGFRHSFATDALSNGVPEVHVAALLGHSSTTMLHKHYSHVSSKAQVLRDALKNVRPEINSAPKS